MGNTPQEKAEYGLQQPVGGIRIKLDPRESASSFQSTDSLRPHLETVPDPDDGRAAFSGQAPPEAIARFSLAACLYERVFHVSSKYCHRKTNLRLSTLVETLLSANKKKELKRPTDLNGTVLSTTDIHGDYYDVKFEVKLIKSQKERDKILVNLGEDQTDTGLIFGYNFIAEIDLDNEATAQAAALNFRHMAYVRGFRPGEKGGTGRVVGLQAWCEFEP